MAVPDTALLDVLRAIVGDRRVIADPAVAAGELTDWTGRWTGSAAVVRPADTGEVAAVLRACAAARTAVVPQGGNTGLVGGSVPGPGDRRPTIVLSTARLDDVEAPDPVGRSIGAGAGAALAAVQAAAARAGLRLGVDLAARDSATVGGMVATNAGGIRMIRYGDMRAQLLGLEAVLASGEVIRRWRPLRKDNVGYHLPGLIAGSEGTLAVVTRVLLRLVDPPRRTAVAMAAVDDPAAAARLLGAVQRSGLIVEAAEVMTPTGLDLVVAGGARPAFPSGTAAGAFLLVETDSGVEELSAIIDRAAADGTSGLVDAVVDEGPARTLWALREGHTEAVARSSSTAPVKLDVSAPLPELPALIDWVDGFAADRGVRAVTFGHLGDGNIHVNLLDVPETQVEQVTDAVLRRVGAVAGSISAEHGIGRAKAASLALGRDVADITAMRAVKDALDPAGILNPGVLFAERSAD